MKISVFCLQKPVFLEKIKEKRDLHLIFIKCIQIGLNCGISKL